MTSVESSYPPAFYIDACCWHAHGWECAANEYTVQDATKLTRAQAQDRFARDLGERWIDIGAWKRYIRPFDRQEQWEWWVEANDWRDDEKGGGWDKHPDLAPDDWEAPVMCEDMPYWSFCLPGHPNAHPVWICGMREDGAPAAAIRRWLRCEFCGRFMRPDGKGHEACQREYDRSVNPNG